MNQQIDKQVVGFIPKVNGLAGGSIAVLRRHSDLAEAGLRSLVICILGHVNQAILSELQQEYRLSSRLRIVALDSVHAALAHKPFRSQMDASLAQHLADGVSSERTVIGKDPRKAMIQNRNNGAPLGRFLDPRARLEIISVNNREHIELARTGQGYCRRVTFVSADNRNRKLYVEFDSVGEPTYAHFGKPHNELDTFRDHLADWYWKGELGLAESISSLQPFKSYMAKTILELIKSSPTRTITICDGANDVHQIADGWAGQADVVSVIHNNHHFDSGIAVDPSSGPYSSVLERVKNRWTVILTEEQKQDIMTERSNDGSHLVVIPNPAPDIARVDDPNLRSKKIAFIGRLSPQKDPECSLHAFSQFLTMTNHDYEFHIFGSGPLEGQLRTLASELKRPDLIHFRGRLNQRDLFIELEAFDVVLASPRHEGHPLAFLELVQLGIPIVTAPFKYGLKEVMHNPKIHVAEKRDPKALAEALRIFYATTQDAGREMTHCELQGREEVVQLWLDLFKKIGPKSLEEGPE